METNIIYLATNTVNGKRYVGLTRGTLSNRWAQHVSIARRKPRSYLHRAIAKYGADVFDIRPIASALRPQYLAPLEVALIADIRPLPSDCLNLPKADTWTKLRYHRPFVFFTIDCRSLPLTACFNQQNVSSSASSEDVYENSARSMVTNI